MLAIKPRKVATFGTHYHNMEVSRAFGCKIHKTSPWFSFYSTFALHVLSTTIVILLDQPYQSNFLVCSLWVPSKWLHDGSTNIDMANTDTSNSTKHFMNVRFDYKFSHLVSIGESWRLFGIPHGPLTTAKINVTICFLCCTRKFPINKHGVIYQL